jgi:hypothetical protein
MVQKARNYSKGAFLLITFTRRNFNTHPAGHHNVRWRVFISTRHSQQRQEAARRTGTNFSCFCLAGVFLRSAPGRFDYIHTRAAKAQCAQPELKPPGE